MSVTVVVPTYNRAHLLEQTIPTYLQDHVERLILVDDCSDDKTPDAAASLNASYPGRLLYLRNDANRKQVYCKNWGKSLAKTDFVYFGDDDSILTAGAIQALLAAQRTTKADIVGVAALYCPAGVDAEERYNQYLRSQMYDQAESFVDMRRLRFHFDRRPSGLLSLPVVHASLLISRDWYTRIDFDLRYTGNCYREETDYVLQAVRCGAHVVFTGAAVQINLPPSLSTGGARSSPRIQYEMSSVVNTWRFLRKHRHYFRHELHTWELVPFLWFVRDRIAALVRRAWR